MRREFKKTTTTYQRFVNIPAYILRAMYSDSTSDATASQNPSIDLYARLRQAIISEDYDMVIDMRTLNKGRPDDTFDVFFRKLKEEVSTVTAADERRHSDVAHFSKYISVRDDRTDSKEMSKWNTNTPREHCTFRVCSQKFL